jgi:hypothetical protein
VPPGPRSIRSSVPRIHTGARRGRRAGSPASATPPPPRAGRTAPRPPPDGGPGRETAFQWPGAAPASAAPGPGRAPRCGDARWRRRACSARALHHRGDQVGGEGLRCAVDPSLGEQPAHQELQRAVEELAPAAGVQLLRGVLRRLEPEHLPSQHPGTGSWRGGSGSWRTAGRRDCRRGASPAPPPAPDPPGLPLNRPGHRGRRRPGAAPTPSGPAAGRSASHTAVAEGRQRRQRHRIDGAGSQIRRHRRLERQANLRPAARRRILQPRHHVRGEGLAPPAR